jgi:Ca-activated chloride channel homolog
MLPGKQAVLLRLFLTLVTIVSLYEAAAWAQSPVDDVHVNPRVQPPSPPKENEIIDPSLRTHTKPIKTNVELVLVPVTITDPLNRLVTGLELHII